MSQAFKGDYKWILYGDDDTFFFVDGVLELLQDFDPSLPYFITGRPRPSASDHSDRHSNLTLAFAHIAYPHCGFSSPARADVHVYV